MEQPDAGQFVNPANPTVHRATTDPEIWADTDGSVDIFAAGVDIGSTGTGVGEYLKSQNPVVNRDGHATAQSAMAAIPQKT